MKKTIVNASIAAVMLSMASCASSPKAGINDLTGEWRIVAVDGQQVVTSPQQAGPYVGFDIQNGRIFGESGCNIINGVLDTTKPDGVISLDGISSTRMACPDMELEQSILNAFNNVEQYKLDKAGNIELLNNNGDVVIKLEKRTDSDLKALSGKWSVSELAGQPLTAEQAADISIAFDINDHTFAVATDCNTLGGTYSNEFVDLKFNLQTATLMACPDDTIEQQFKALLPTITHYDNLDGSNIGLYDDDNVLQLVISPIAAPEQ
jgi:heat shock protein HslJ